MTSFRGTIDGLSVHNEATNETMCESSTSHNGTVIDAADIEGRSSSDTPANAEDHDRDTLNIPRLIIQ